METENNYGYDQETEETRKILIQYRGKATDKFEESLKRIKAPVTVITTIKKLKTCLPSLKVPVDKLLQSKVVYKVSCSRCEACYVGQTARHLITRTKEHLRTGPVAIHNSTCGGISMDNVSVLTKTNRSVYHLMTLEALFIKEIKPNLNTKDEYRSRSLTIKL